MEILEFPFSLFVFFSSFEMSEVSQENLKGSTIETKQNHTSGEFQNISAAYRLNGKNYLQWSQLVRTFLKGKGKLIHLIGGGPDSSDPKFTSQDEEDSMIMSQLWNPTEPNIAGTCMFLNSAHEIQEDIRQTYSKMRDVASVMRSRPKFLPQNKVHVQLLNMPIL